MFKDSDDLEFKRLKAREDELLDSFEDKIPDWVIWALARRLKQKQKQKQTLPEKFFTLNF